MNPRPPLPVHGKGRLPKARPWSFLMTHLPSGQLADEHQEEDIFCSLSLAVPAYGHKWLCLLWSSHVQTAEQKPT